MTNVPNSPAAIEAERRQLIEIGKKLIRTGDPPFTTDIEITRAEPLAKNLFVTKDSSEAHLAAVLYMLSIHRSWTDAGFQTFRDYAESRIGIDGSRANALVSQWEAFISVGLSPVVLRHISWSKFRELVPAIKAGTITDANIEEWVPHLTSTPPHGLTNAALKRLVAAAMADKKAETTPDEKTRLSVEVSAEDRGDIINYLNTIAEKTGKSAAGDIIKAALERQVTEVVSDSVDLGINRSLTQIKEIAEHLADNVRVIFLAPDDPKKYNEETLGVVPFTAIYTTLRRDKFALAASEEEAKHILKSDTVERHPILTSSILDDTDPDDVDEDDDDDDDGGPDDDGTPSIVTEEDTEIKDPFADDITYTEVDELPESIKPKKSVNEFRFKVDHITTSLTKLGAKLPYEDTPLPLLPSHPKCDKKLYGELRKIELKTYLKVPDLDLVSLTPTDYLDFPPYPKRLMDEERYSKDVKPARSLREDEEFAASIERDKLWKAACIKVLVLKQSANPPESWGFDEIIQLNTRAWEARKKKTPGVELLQ